MLEEAIFGMLLDMQHLVLVMNMVVVVVAMLAMLVAIKVDSLFIN